MKKENFLDEILRYKRQEIEKRKKIKPLENLISVLKKDQVIPNFEKAITRKRGEKIKLIAEIKKASPSKGQLCADFDPVSIAQIYQREGAHAISVLTDEKYFQGNLENLKAVSEAVSLPLLRKDFILDEYQVYEAKSYGASAILLIVAALDKEEIVALLGISRKIGVHSLVEVHDEEELERALACGATLLGINNRDLQSFKVDLSTCENLSKNLPKECKVVVESGILSRQDVERVSQLPVDAILVGEAFMTSFDIAEKIKELMNG